MKRLDRYVLSGFAIAWLASFVFFTGMYLIIHFFNKLGSMSKAAEHFREQGWTPFEGFCLYYALNLPFVMVQTAPFTILMGAMWAAQQMARKNELVPVLVGGVSFRRLALPLLLAGFVLALGFATVKEKLLPALAAKRHRIERVYKGSKRDVIKRLRQIEDGTGNVFHIREYHISSRTAQGVNVLPRDWGPREDRLYMSAMTWKDQRWVPYDSVSEPVGRLLKETDLHPRDIELESRGLLFMDVDDLRRMIARHPDRTNLQVMLHGHFAYPLGTVVLLLMGLPLVLKGTRRSPFMAAGVSLLLSIAFFAVQSVLQDLGARDEFLNPILGAWLPIITFGALGVLLFETMPT